MAAKYQIPAEMLTWTADVTSIVLHEGVYVNTADSYTSFPASESLCAFCDGARTVTCPTCYGADVVGDGDTECHNCKDGSVRCPQAAARWCHE